MQNFFFSLFTSPAAQQIQAGDPAVEATSPVELSLAELEAVAGGFGPAGTWLISQTAAVQGPAGTW